MKLDDKLLRQATLGTMPPPKQGLEDLSSAMFQSLNLPYESHLFLQIGMSAFQGRAGFVAPILADLARHTIPSRHYSAISFEAMEYLLTIAHPSSNHFELLPEWCRMVVKSEQYLPDEFAPTILNLGNKFETVRIYIRAILSERAIWIAQESRWQDWQWAVETPMPSEEQLAAINKNWEAYFIARMRDNHAKNNFSVISDLGVYLQPWSENLANIFLEYLSKSTYLIVKRGTLSWHNIIDGFTTYAPLDSQNNFFGILQNNSWDSKVDLTEALALIHFRREMQKAIYASLHD